MTEVKIRVESHPTTDVYMRYHGKAVDQVLNDDWWITQPHKTIAITGYPVVHEETLDLVEGEHTVEYAASGYVPDYAWHAKIFVNGELVAEGDVGRYTHLKTTFWIAPLPPPPTPSLWQLIPALTPIFFNLAVILYSEASKIAI